MNKKLVWLLVGVVVLIGGLFALKQAGVIGGEEGIKVTTEKVAKRTIIETVNASGKVYPEVEVKVSSDISGEIVELTVEEGDSVRKGQVLAKIFADIYLTQRDQVAASVRQQQAIVENSQAQLEALQSALAQSEAQFRRQEQLMKEKVISRAEFEQAENAYNTAKANYNAGLQTITANKASVASTRANLESANKNLGRTTILAPMNGVVSLMAVKKGERVVGTAQMTGTEMMRIADMDKIEVRVEVGENDIPKVHLGDSALIEIDAYNARKFKGIVTQIASSSKALSSATATAVTNDVTNYEVRIRLLKESYQDLIDPSRPKSFPFRPGMSASADIQTKRKADVLAVPINAVTTREKDSDKAVNETRTSTAESGENNNKPDDRKSISSELDEVVFVLEADKTTVRRVKVRTDIQDITYIEVLSGLKEGDEVITGPYSLVSKTLKNKDKVKVVKKEELFEKKK
ncbi:efflux RND transporter periplasmic adaptor subunit [Flavihumibacter sp. CACIAM 22H1]|uniref:efflux RND transporter periplasmic adaptor subunit n=1 Tax=Flavihumibacter sp. CACIAM 22H1 TaxID=1812911 RepID=UPI0007A8570F|nr:efflux RND transporter periplasmic adaptor subunit [Flavihumibacter sp. CACIAM 22H1]KYP15304.1 MAG: efflux transporter periplasmic adaptor subunit [Flavihumibacter sp. CACIAM 22H1]